VGPVTKPSSLLNLYCPFQGHGDMTFNGETMRTGSTRAAEPRHGEEVMPLNQEKMETFVGKVLGDSSATMTTMLAILGDRLGLFRAMAGNGSTTAAELAATTGTNERYVREWLGGMTSSGYVDYDATSGEFTLPPEHAPTLAQEGGPVFFGGVYHMLPHLMGALDHVEESFRNGGGVHQAKYDERFWDGLERFTRGWFDNLLLQEWIPAMPDVKARLEAGATMADVGCGRGRALIKLAEAFPRSKFVGYDSFGPTIEKATARAVEAGVGDRISFQECDVSKGLSDKYDLVSTFDVVHDAVDPVGLVKNIRKGLKDDGIYVCLDINCSDKLEENTGPLGAMFHGFSVTYCMTTSLAHGGTGLGTLGFHEPMVHELCKEAGFSKVRALPLENPFNKVYEIRP
jgi:SAM-dependent methyltransferase